jgi:hypothetical protein
MDSPKSDSSTEELFEAAIFTTNTLLPLLFENDRALSEPEPQAKRGGSIEGKRGNIDRMRVFYHHLLIQDYFSADPTYDHQFFRRRFRMRRELFLRIMTDLGSTNDFFTWRTDAAKQMGLSPHQKVCAAIQFLATGSSADSLDDKYRMAESTMLQTLRIFLSEIIKIYADEYLSPPNQEQLQAIMTEYESLGWPGCIGAFDVMRWEWKNCPIAWRGTFQGKEKVASIALECIASSDLRIWHLYCGSPGSHNDLNILDSSPVLDSYVRGERNVTYHVNETE